MIHGDSCFAFRLHHNGLLITHIFRPNRPRPRQRIQVRAARRGETKALPAGGGDWPTGRGADPFEKEGRHFVGAQAVTLQKP